MIMKTLVIALFLFGNVAHSIAQDLLFEAKLEKENVPTVIIESVEEDFPEFTMEQFDAVPIQYIEEDVVINRDFNADEDYNTYEITLSGKGRRLTATYDKSGKLLSTIEKGTNEFLPYAVREAVAKANPGWTIVKDSYKMMHFTGHNAKERYKITLGKGNETMKIVTDANGKQLRQTREQNQILKKSIK